MKGVTIKDIAAAVGLSTSTVSRALTQHPKIPESTRTRVVEAAQRLNYRPNMQARALKGSATATIGLIVPSLGNQYFATLAHEITESAKADRLSVITLCSNDSRGEFLRALDILRQQRVDGVIVVPHHDTARELEQCRDAGTPVVLVDRRFLGTSGTSLASVDSDPRPGISAAVGLLAKKHHAIGYLAGPQDTSTGAERTRAFEEACERHRVEPLIYQGGYTEHEGYLGTAWLVDQQLHALIAGDSMMTTGALRHCHHCGIMPGRELDMVGFDDFPVFALQSVPLTIIDQDVSTMARQSYELVRALIRGDDPPAGLHRRLPTKLVIRASTATAKESDE